MAAFDSMDAATATERLLVIFATLTLDPEVVAMTRLVLGECHAFPEIGAAFYEKAILRTSAAMEKGLRRLCDRGLIAVDDPAEAVSMLRGMIAMEPQRAAMLGQREPPDAAEIAARARRCAQIFLEGCAVRQPVAGQAAGGQAAKSRSHALD